jgi:threonine dehydratase
MKSSAPGALASDAVGYPDVVQAAATLKGHAHHTPVVTSRSLDALLSARLYFKCENLQRAGAFKFRGAFNALSRLNPEARRQGVLAYSSGNHAQAIALAGRELSVPTTIVMPTDAPRVKLDATRGYGGEVVLYDRTVESREAVGARIASERGLTVIPPYDHKDVIAGQGTTAYELLQDAGPLDLLVVPCGGGGLLSGCAVAAATLAPDCKIVGVEPAAADDAMRSFRTGVLHVSENPATIADGARTPSLGKLTFPLVRHYVDDFAVATDSEIVAAMRLLWERLKLIVEPTGALAAAAVLCGLVPVAGQRVGIVLSGGNVELGQAAAWFAGNQ